MVNARNNQTTKTKNSTNLLGVLVIEKFRFKQGWGKNAESVFVYIKIEGKKYLKFVKKHYLILVNE